MRHLERLADNVRALMKQHGNLTQDGLKARSGISQAQISNILRKAQNPQLDTLAAIAGAFGLEPWQLLQPTEALERPGGEGLAKLSDFYLRCDSEGRAVILAVARAQADALR